jgi:NADPH2:quinone reductase
MQVVTAPPHGGIEVLGFAERPPPSPGAGQLLVRVRAIGVNRADAMQRAGRYWPPPGESDVLGLELAGEVVETGAGVSRFAAGDRIFGLVSAGAYAEFALVDAGLALPVPPPWGFATAAAVIETFCTANETLFVTGGLIGGETVLIHAGGSGVATSGIQMAKHAGATVFVTAGSAAKLDRALGLGADAGINYRTHDFADETMRLTNGRGVDLVIDFIGATYMPRHLRILRETGRLVLAGLLGEASHPIDTSPILHKRLRVEGFTLRPQTLAAKRAIVDRFAARWLPVLEAGAIRPIIHRVLPFADVREAHRILEANENFGKVVLTVP